MVSGPSYPSDFFPFDFFFFIKLEFSSWWELPCTANASSVHIQCMSFSYVAGRSDLSAAILSIPIWDWFERSCWSEIFPVLHHSYTLLTCCSSIFKLLWRCSFCIPILTVQLNILQHICCDNHLWMDYYNFKKMLLYYSDVDFLVNCLLTWVELQSNWCTVVELLI